MSTGCSRPTPRPGRVLRCAWRARTVRHGRGGTSWRPHSRRGPAQRPAERRRRELLEAADRVVLRDGPEASMNAIAAEAGITKPILYRHFGDKGGLYRALAIAAHRRPARRAARRAGRPRRAPRPGRGHPGHLPRGDRGPPQVYRFLMHPAEDGQPPASRASTSAATPPRCCAAWARSWRKVIARRVDLGPGGEELARVWGHGIVGMMLRRRRLVAGRTPLLPRRSWCASLADLLWGRLADGRGPAPGATGPRDGATADRLRHAPVRTPTARRRHPTAHGAGPAPSHTPGEARASASSRSARRFGTTADRTSIGCSRRERAEEDQDDGRQLRSRCRRGPSWP